MKKNKKRLIGIISAIIAIIIAIIVWNNYSQKAQIIKIPPHIAQLMRDMFKRPGRTLEKLEPHIKDIQYPLSVFTMITNDIDADLNKEDYTLRVHFIQITPDFVSKYSHDTSIKSFEKKLYLAFEYVDKNHKRVGKTFILNEAGKKYYIDSYFTSLCNAYKSNIKNSIDTLVPNKKNTEYVKIDVKELYIYIGEINKYNANDLNTTPKIIKFELAESTSMKKTNQLGYLTFINNIVREDSPSHPIDQISEYDMNTLCPPNCP